MAKFFNTHQKSYFDEIDIRKRPSINVAKILAELQLFKRDEQG